MNRKLAALTAVTVSLVASLSGALAPAVVYAADPPPYPASMASAGDSITRAFDIGYCCILADSPQYSWSTGTDPQVNSQYQRLLALNPLIEGNVFNDARTGAKMADLDGQLRKAAVQNAEYVTVLMGANDLCTSTIAGMTPTATLRSQVHIALTNFFSASPTSLMELLSIPNIYQLYLAGKDNFSARSAWALYGICQSMLRSSNTETDRLAVVAQEDADNAALRDECALFVNCLWDNYTTFNYSFQLSQLSSVDYFHPNFSGQNAAAEISWNASYWATPPP